VILNNGATCTIDSQKGNIITSVSRSGLGRCLITLDGSLSVIPSYSGSVITTNAFVTFEGAAINSVTSNTLTDAGTLVDRRFTVVIIKQGVDVVRPVVQPILVNQVETPQANGTKTTVCRIDNSGTPATGSPLCDSWVDSLVDNAAGDVTINVTPGTFSVAPDCVATAFGNGFGVAHISSPSTTTVRLRTFATDTTVGTDRVFFVNCQGER